MLKRDVIEMDVRIWESEGMFGILFMETCMKYVLFNDLMGTQMFKIDRTCSKNLCVCQWFCWILEGASGPVVQVETMYVCVYIYIYIYVYIDLYYHSHQKKDRKLQNPTKMVINKSDFCLLY